MNKKYSIHNLCLSVSIVVMLSGLLVKMIRPVALPLGLCFLVASYVLERNSRKHLRYRLGELSSRSDVMGVISAPFSQLLISDQWSLGRCVKLDGFEGYYNVKVTERFKDEFSLIAKIQIESGAQSAEEEMCEVESITVDTGWLLFMSSSAVGDFKPKALKEIIQGELETLPRNKPLFLLLKKQSLNIGVVVSTGEGDGVYEIKYRTIGGKLASIETTFISTC